MRFAAIIPARGGSKGIERKNLATLSGGQTLVERTVAQALRCFPAEDVFVTTEDAEIAAMAAKAGARVIERPHELADDDSPTGSAVTHLLETVDPERETYDALVLLQVTSPLRGDEDIKAATRKLVGSELDSVVSARLHEGVHPAKMYFADGDEVRPVMSDEQPRRRQDLPPVMVRNGAVYCVMRDWFENSGMLWGGKAGLVFMPAERSIDIDGPDDLARVERLLAGQT